MNQPVTIFSFAIDLPLYHLFDYSMDEALAGQPGQRFMVPFGKGEKVGLLVAPVAQSKHESGKIKPVRASLDSEPIMSDSLMKLAGWMASYYCQPLSEVLFNCLPRYCRQPRSLKPTGLHYWVAQETGPELINTLHKKAPRQFQIFQSILNSERGLNAFELRVIHSGWRQQVNSLQKKGLVVTQWRENLPVQPQPRIAGPKLTSAQKQIVDTIKPVLDKFQVHLIQGVTGSGKTEIYLDLMKQVIASGKQVIYLVPEIGLTPQLLQRLQQRLGSTVVSSHSGQSDFLRYQSWDQFKRGVVPVLIGTRSALFSDSPLLGLIIVDEEHDASYRQQDGLRYHARDVAIKRAQMLNIPIILGSATPSLESLHNLEKPYYRLHKLDQRPNNACPPRIQLVDCNHAPLNSGCSAQLLQAMEKHLDRHGQVLLYLNRRGFAPVVMCHDCGWQASCYQCDARLTLHQSLNKLICHHCSYSLAVPSTCPDCGAAEIFHYGVGTQQLERFLKTRFAQLPIIRIDRDSVSSAKPMDSLLQPVRAGDPCILIGTQMLAKGHDYPNITLVGILDADQALYSSFYRATERLVQTVLQVSGRAGRAEKGGQALLQTAFPNHPLMRSLCSQGYSQLVKPMLEERRLLGFPPYARAVSFLVDASDLSAAMQRLQRLKDDINTLSASADVKIIGPIPALMTRRLGRFRAQLSVLADDIRPVRLLMNALMPQIRGMRNSESSRLVIDVDPVDL